jgi:uncharacterized protein
MNLFVDSSGWIALFDSNDKYYQLASKAMNTLQGKVVNFLTSDYVIDESLTYLRKKTGHRVATHFGQWILAAQHIKFIRVDEAVWQAAWEMFQVYDDKEWAFTDCTSFVLMRQLRLWQAFSFDQHFVQAGFQLWPDQTNQ